jgi:hypothetical protein
LKTCLGIIQLRATKLSVGIAILQVKLGQEKGCEDEVEGLITWATSIFSTSSSSVGEVAARGSSYVVLPCQSRVQHPLDGLIL